MIPAPLRPYVDRVRLLGPDVRADAFLGARDDLALARREAFTAATGRLHRYGLALRALGEAPDPELGEVLFEAALSLRVAWRPVGGAAEAGQARLRELAAWSLALSPMAARSPASPAEPRSPVDALRARLSRRGDPEVAAERLGLLEDADDALSCVAAVEVTGAATPDRLRWVGPSLQVARRALGGLDDGTRWRVQAAAQEEALGRELFTDPYGGPMWLGVLAPEELAGLLARERDATREAEAAAEAGRVHTPARLAAASLERGLPGEILAMFWDEEADEGYVARLRVCAEGEHGGRDASWGPAARRAIRDAWAAAAALLPPGVLPPASVEEHRVSLDVEAPVDGASIGLPAALAFWSLWTDLGLPRFLAATGALRPDGEVTPVHPRGLEAKLRRHAGQYRGGEALALVPDQDLPAGRRALRCASLAGALGAIEAERTRAAVVSRLGTVEQREQALLHAVAAVKNQRIERGGYGESLDPWLLLADRLALLVRSLAEVGETDADLDDARVWAALAYLHAGDPSEAGRMLAEARPSSPEAALLRAVMELNRAVDSPRADEDALAERVRRAAGESERAQSRCYALGTLGRFHLHRHRPGEARPLLEAALAAAPLRERARSGGYLSMALRAGGEPAAALAVLDAAEQALPHTQEHSVSYARETRMYLRYERARVLLALGSAAEALEVIEEALGLLGDAGGWWPRAGFLRTRARALRALGRAGEAEAVVTQLRALLPAEPGEHAALCAGLVIEAEGGEAGVVY